ncbi:cytochrome C biogenesis protein [Achromatium sp. WMS1]|nr:cytochrome C biogenesis protein [Achromatium sp. WMS1]
MLYLGTFAIITIRLFWSKTQYISRTLGLSIGATGVIMHGFMLYPIIVTPSGINLGFFNALSLVIWTVLAMMLLSSITKPLDNLGIALFPLGALAMVLERSFPGTYFLSQSAPWGLRLHVLVSLLAYSFLTLASVQAVLLAIQDHHLHTHHPGGFVRSLPPLQTMETLLFEMIGTGFFLLTISLASGFLFLQDMFAQHLAHKTILAVFGWLLFGALLLGRFRAGWRGRTVIVWTLSGFIVLILAYFGSKAVLELILERTN